MTLKFFSNERDWSLGRTFEVQRRWKRVQQMIARNTRVAGFAANFSMWVMWVSSLLKFLLLLFGWTLSRLTTKSRSGPECFLKGSWNYPLHKHCYSRKKKLWQSYKCLWNGLQKQNSLSSMQNVKRKTCMMHRAVWMRVMGRWMEINTFRTTIECK